MQVKRIETYVKAISCVYKKNMKDHLLEKMIEEVFKVLPEFCVRFVEEYAPQILPKLQEAESKHDFPELKVPLKIAEEYAWKGRWGVADFEGQVGVALTNCSLEGRNLWLSKFTTMGRLVSATDYIQILYDFVKEDACESIEQPAKLYARVPTVTNTNWRTGI